MTGQDKHPLPWSAEQSAEPEQEWWNVVDDEGGVVVERIPEDTAERIASAMGRPCEGCGKPACTEDVESVPLCHDCAAQCINDEVVAPLQQRIRAAGQALRLIRGLLRPVQSGPPPAVESAYNIACMVLRDFEIAEDSPGPPATSDDGDLTVLTGLVSALLRAPHHRDCRFVFGEDLDRCDCYISVVAKVAAELGVSQEEGS